MSKRFRAVSATNAEIHRFDAHNPKGTAILVQGWNCRATELEGLAKVLVENGYSARTFELPGVGKTTLGETKAPDYFKHAAGIMAEICLADKIERPIVVSHSMGGYMANAYLRLVNDVQGDTVLTPRAMYEITPGKINPVLTLPTDKNTFRATGWATRLLINLSKLTAQRAEEKPTEVNEKLRLVSLKAMLHAFDILGPIMIRLIGGSREAAAEFGNFTKEALGFDPQISAEQVLAMCKYAPNLRRAKLPRHIRQVYGEHDIFIGSRESIGLALQMYRGVNFTFKVLPTGHFPHRENLQLLTGDMLEFLERV